ncbi:MAG: hypothetical protein QOF77_1927 [Solirubrobacteraceae bacterium]|jgi:putative FmdB family regulatory protein|nr:hypothetical protein [Solirubrobacteraceae bacterium]
MPIYEYRCQEGHTFEVMRRMTDEPLSVCQTCSAPVEQVFHPIAVHFKGKGFYNTDYGTKKRAREMKESSGEGSKSETGPSEGKSSEATSSESKPSESKSAESKAGESTAKAEKKAPAPAPKKSSD